MKLVYSTIIYIYINVLTVVSLSAQNYAISGYIVDANTKETIIGATIRVEGLNNGVITDINGFFQYTGLKSGVKTLIISHVGYQTRKLTLRIEDNSVLLEETLLQPRVLTVEELTIVAIKPDVIGDRDVETAMKGLSSKAIRSIPAAKNDVMEAIKYLPGIENTGPTSPLFSVRGGDPSENGVFMDGVLIYNPYHPSIASGIFNTHMIKKMDLMVGGYGAEYGGHNSSIMYVTTKDGNSNELHGDIQPGTLHSKGFVEFPVGHKGSAMIAGRYFFDLFSQFLLENNNYFYDVNLSYTYRANKKNRLTFKYFYSKDYSNLDFRTMYAYLGNSLGIDALKTADFRVKNNWNNKAATIIHKFILTPRLYMRNQVYYSAHNSNNSSSSKLDAYLEVPDTIPLKLDVSSRFVSRIQNITLKSIVNYKLALFSKIRFGMEYNMHVFDNDAFINDVDQNDIKRYPGKLAYFAENKIQLGPFIARPGIRVIDYNNSRYRFSPRFNATLILPYSIRLKAAWGRYYQNIISLNTGQVEFTQNVDYYYPLITSPASKSIHYLFGLEKRMSTLSFMLDFYYKDLQRVYTFNFFNSNEPILKNKLDKGKGEAYGAELMVQGKYRDFSGWIGYSISWANRSFPSIDNGESYPYEYNNRHALKSVINFVMTKTLSVNASFTYLSGKYKSIEQNIQSYYTYDPVTNKVDYFPIYISDNKNNAKMPSILNLDLSIIKRLRKGFGKDLADKFNATESYATITIRNLLFFRRNISHYFPGFGFPFYNDKYIPLGSNYIPSVGFSYSIKF